MEFEKKKGYAYDLVPPEEPIELLKEPIVKEPFPKNDEGEKERTKNKKKGKKLRFRKSFCLCCSNVEIGSKEQSHDDEKKKAHDGSKVKDYGFLFSNVEIEPEEDKEKVLEVVEKMRNKRCFLVCCSNIEVDK